MKFVVPVLLLAACASAFAQEAHSENGRKLAQADVETYYPPFLGTAPKLAFDQVHHAIFGFNAEGSKLVPDAFAPAPSAVASRRQLKQTTETFLPPFLGTAPKPTFDQVHKAIFGFNAEGSKLVPDAFAPAPSAHAAVEGRRHLQQAETFGPFLGTAPKPLMSEIHQAIFGFNKDSQATPEALMAKAPAPSMGRKLLEANKEQYYPLFLGTAPKPTFDQIHKAIFGFNADGSKLVPDAFAPVPAAHAHAAVEGRRHLLQPRAETFGPFLGTAPKPTFGDVHRAVFGFNQNAHSETFFGTAPKPSPSDIHRMIFGFNKDNQVVPEAFTGKAPAPAPMR